ncbi:hypothetical protein C8034_v003669 [Colletotrichum sidae]|uniref:Uncharacterized protein n=1 Tax=Colletotrichum sidae TaxID=1347389 RepID=A0A4R8TAH4_9PEZI|nr:hypothetical protein C8034_v003669 [Colletotrichum sidae]
MENVDFGGDMQTYAFDLPDTNFDSYSDPNLFFDFEACADGQVPDAAAAVPASPPRAVPEPIFTLKNEPPRDQANSTDTDNLNLEDLFGDFVMEAPTPQVRDDITSTLPVDHDRSTPGNHVSPLPLPNPLSSGDKGGCSTDMFDSLLADLSVTADASFLPQEPNWLHAPVDPSPFSCKADPTLVNNLDFFATDGNTGTRDTTYPSPQGTEVITALPHYPFFRGASKPGEIPFAFDETPPSFFNPFDPVVSSTGSQFVLPSAPATSTTSLQHPRPVNPVSPNFFIKAEDIPEARPLGAPPSTLDPRGNIRATPAPASLSPFQTPKRDLVTPVVNGKVIKRIPRPAKAKDVDANEWYSRPEPLAAWGGSDPENDPLFRYNGFGEWLPRRNYARDEILYYFTERRRLNLPLTLWVQNSPHGCVNRVQDGGTLKCRWNGCPSQNGTILKGFWRVCFDERPETSGATHNPFHNAGYMHLWCMDKCFDLIEIAQAFDMRPDTRHFEKEEKNPMAMTRDHDDLMMEYELWRETQQKAYEEWRTLCETNKMLGLPTENRVVERDQKLWFILTTKHLALETVVRQTMRDSRNGLSMDKHKGDVAWYARKVVERKKHTRAQKDAGSRALAKLVDCEGVSDDDEEAVIECQLSRPMRVAKRKHEVDGENDKENSHSPIKRSRRRHDSVFQDIGGNRRQSQVDGGDAS